MHGLVRQGGVRLGPAGCGLAWQGLVGMVGFGEVRRGQERSGVAWLA